MITMCDMYRDLASLQNSWSLSDRMRHAIQRGPCVTCMDLGSCSGAEPAEQMPACSAHVSFVCVQYVFCSVCSAHVKDFVPR